MQWRSPIEPASVTSQRESMIRKSLGDDKVKYLVRVDQRHYDDIDGNNKLLSRSGKIRRMCVLVIHTRLSAIVADDS